MSFIHDGETTRTAEVTIEAIMERSFPGDDPNADTLDHVRMRESMGLPLITEDGPPWKEAEVEMALEALQPGKASGPDMISNDILKNAKTALASILTSVYNRCLDEGVFPRIWKEAEMVAVLKPGVTIISAKSYRPICLLNVMGKILERLILQHLKGVIGQLSPDQFGGRKGQSTTDAINQLITSATDASAKYFVVLLYDVAGAFDNLWWPAIMHELKTLNCPRNIYNLILSFLEGRSVFYSLPGKRVRRTIKRGCAQGSVLGLPLWNINMFCSDPSGQTENSRLHTNRIC